MKRRVYIVLAVMIVLVPLGLLSESPAWGEWEDAYYQKVLGFLPEGINHAKGISPLIPDYTISRVNETVGYYLSALIGLVLIFLIYYLLAKLLRRRGKDAS